MMLIFKNKKKLSKNGERTLSLMVSSLKKNGVSARVESLENVEIFLETGNARAVIGKKSVLESTMIYFRKVGVHRNIAFIISNLSQKKNIFFIDRFHQKIHARGKLIQMFLLAMNGVPIPKTYHSLAYDRKKIRNAVSWLKLPIVVKATNLGGGRMIYLAKNGTEIEKIIKKHPDTEFIFQEFIRNNFDYRIVVLGGKASVAEKRIRVGKKEFRNNACVGGKEIFLCMKDVPKRIKEIAISAAGTMDVQVAGVDVVRSISGKDFVFEVNV